MKFDGIWGTLCNYQFDTRDARVACKQFGFRDGMPHHISPGTGPIWINAFFCSGSETSLLKCMSTGFNSTFMNSSCAGHKSDAGVDCYNETMSKSCWNVTTQLCKVSANYACILIQNERMDSQTNVHSDDQCHVWGDDHLNICPLAIYAKAF